MKRLLFVVVGLSVLAGCMATKGPQVITGDGSNIAMACKQPYEEVSKIRIGCPVDASKMTKISTNELGIEEYAANLPDSFFSVVRVKVVNGNVEGVLFTRTYQDEFNSDMNKEMKSLREALQKRWGKDTPFHLNGRTKVDSYSFRNPRGGILYNVMATQMTDRSIGLISVDYTSKKLQSHEKGVADSENARRVESFGDL